MSTSDRVNRDYKRENGIYYTPESVAYLLTKWAVRSPEDRILDPSYGGCAFLSCAIDILCEIGAIEPTQQIFGVDVDPGAESFALGLRDRGVPDCHLWEQDFMKLDNEEFPRLTTIVGNPPYVRHHLLTPDYKETAQSWTKNRGIKLSKRSSYWAYFVVKSADLVAAGGRLAMVLPESFLQADYALEVRKVLLNSFRRVEIIRVSQPLFEETAERSVLLFADDKGAPNRDVVIGRIGSVADLKLSGTTLQGYSPVEERTDQVGSSSKSWAFGISKMIGSATRRLYRDIVTYSTGEYLGELAKIRIGAVTGANRYFIINRGIQEQWNIPDDCIRVLITRADQLKDVLMIKQSHIKRLRRNNERVLLVVPPTGELPASLVSYYEYGESMEIQKGYKCQNRKPWYNTISDFDVPDAFLTYMNWAGPRLVINAAKVDSTNTIHRLQWTAKGLEYGPEWISLAMISSFVQFQVEMLGTTYGGGVLKLEPGRAGDLWIPSLSSDVNLPELWKRITSLYNRGQWTEARDVVDTVIAESVGLSFSHLEILRAEVATAREHRMWRKFRKDT